MKKVYFNHIPGNIHPVYQEMLDNPPEGVEYINKNNFGKNYQNNAIHDTNPGIFIWIKGLVLDILRKIYFLPNLTFRKLPGDITYSCQDIPLFGDYILDIDCYEALNRFSNRISENFINKFVIKFFLRQERCKQIVFWSDNTKKGFQKYVGNIFDHKIQVLYPAIKVEHNLDAILQYKDKDKINILFVGRYFERKGGNIVTEIADYITQKYNNVHFHFITQANRGVLNKYRDNNQIFFTGLLPRNEVIEHFKKSDIFFMPTFQEIFGMVFIEAFAFGSIPISMDTFALNNIIDNGVDGFVIDYKNKFHTDDYQFIDKYNSDINLLLKKIDEEEKGAIILKIIEKIEFLIINSKEMIEMRKKGFEKIKNGKFSIEFRNQQLQHILYR